jgi:hypothetical protein
MKPLLLATAFLFSASAAAQTTPAYTPAPLVVGPATPAPEHAGSWELLLMAPPAIEDTLVASPHGLGLGQTTAAGSGLFGYLGLSGGVGYALTDLLQVGGAVSFIISGVSPVADGTSGYYQLLGEPFLKLNFGPALKTGALNPFALAGFEFGLAGYTGAAGQAWGLFGLDIDPGVEWLFGGRWGIDAFIPIQFQFATYDHAQVGINLGIGYGLVGYL